MAQIKEAYLDSTVFITAAVGTDMHADKARKIISSVENGIIYGYTSVLTFDEVVFIVRKLADFEKSAIAGEIFLNTEHLNFINVSYETILSANDLIKKYRLKPRDAIHAACALRKNVFTIISDDNDFDVLKEIKRVSIKDFKV